MREQPRKRFEYQKRAPEDVEARANQSGGTYDQIFRPEFAMFFPKVRKDPYCVRFLPPIGEGAKHYGLELHVHSQVGADNQRYLCLEQNIGCEKDVVCPVCEESRALKRQGEDDPAYALKAKKHVATWVIDRDDEKAGPLIWKFIWMDDRDITALSINKRNGEVMYLDDPDNGYDLEFSCVQQGDYSKLSGLRIAQRPTPLSDDARNQDDWLAYVQENPLSATLQFFPSAHILKVLNGGKTREEGATRDEPESRQSRRQVADDAPRRSSLRDEPPVDDAGYEPETLDQIDEPPRRQIREEPPPRRSRGDEEPPPETGRLASRPPPRQPGPPPRRAAVADDYPDEPPRQTRRPLR